MTVEDPGQSRSDEVLASDVEPGSDGAGELDDLKASRWGTAPAELVLGQDEVHVWRAKLNAKAAEVEEMVGVLSWRERRAMKRTDKPKDFAARIHMVRTLLGRYLERDPAKLKLRAGPGDHLLLDEDGAPHFDLTTSHRRALFAISASHRVAVVMDAIPSEDEVRARIRDMPPREARQVEFLSPQNRAQTVVGYQMERLATQKLEAAGGMPGRVERLKVGGADVAALAADGWDWSASLWRYYRPGERRDESEDEE